MWIEKADIQFHLNVLETKKELMKIKLDNGLFQKLSVPPMWRMSDLENRNPSQFY